MASILNIEHKYVSISFDDETEKWSFSLEDEQFVSDTLREARDSINKMLLAERKNLTPFPAFYIKDYRSPAARLFPVIVTNYSKNQRVYIKPDGKINAGEAPMFFNLNGYQKDKLFLRDSGAEKTLLEYQTAVNDEKNARERTRIFEQALDNISLKEDGVKIGLSPKLKMKELQK